MTEEENMNHPSAFPIFAFLLAILALLVTAGLAQDEKAPERNPFAVPPGVQAPNNGDATQFVPRDRPAGVPPLSLRGYVEDKEGKACALLDVGGKQVYLVREKDEVSIPQGADNLVLRITKVSNLSLQLEMGELRRVVVVR
jgi:hypothetical protein